MNNFNLFTTIAKGDGYKKRMILAGVIIFETLLIASLFTAIIFMTAIKIF